MRLAREFNRPDWRAMLAGMSSTELMEWAAFYKDHYFQSHQLDAHFSHLSYLIMSMAGKHELTPVSFSLLNPLASAVELSDEELMSVAESIPGGIRYDPVSG
ncbi:phage tail assembly protein T [Rahnella inusitata]|uniref:phage tail assembly protein T n=1 Tax=Rahnella inusitata TaxID=58169 RepID=UPI0039BE31F3